MENGVIEKTKTEHQEELLSAERSVLLLYNDDVNTFEHVIDCLIEICSHEPEQAEQCAHIVHFSGKCVIRTGSKKTLTPMCTALCDRGLSAVIN